MYDKKNCPRCKGTNIKKDYEHGEEYCADCGASYYEDYEEQLKSKTKRGTCPECGRTDIINDPHNRERICANCGMVLR